MIWVIAGTSDGRIIADKIVKHGFEVIVTTSTEYGKKLIERSENVCVIQCALNENEMEVFIDENEIRLIVDASHPYAKEVSMNAIAASENKNIKYLRFERKSIDNDYIKSFGSYVDIAKYLAEKEGNILLTIGSKNIGYFKNLEKSRVFLRVLSTSYSVLQCEENGFLPDNIIAVKGNFSKEFNKSLIKEFKIKFLVTKESGEAGGFNEKVEAAIEEEIDVLMIERPFIKYPEVYHENDSILNRIGEILRL